MPAIIGELVLVVALSWGLQRMSPTLAGILFAVYAALNGFTLSVVAFAYTGESIVIAFGATALLFGAMTVVGFTTNIDLSQYRGILFMGLIGLVIAGLVNLFLQSNTFAFIMSFFGVAIFTGLTAWDTQKLKNLAAAPELQDNPEMLARMSVFGALILYLDFVNLFLFLLRLFGRRR
jgi:FtsH-binding integral membrane protein